MGEMVLGQFAACEDGIDQCEAGGGAIAHRHGYGAVQLDNGRRHNTRKYIVKRHDLRPIGQFGISGLSMYRCDCRLEGIGAETPRCQSLLHQSDPFLDLIFVPEGPVLVVEKDQIALRRGARGAARFVQKHQGEETGRLGFGKQLQHQATQPDCLGGKVGSGDDFPDEAE